MMEETGDGPSGMDRDLGMIYAEIKALRELASDFGQAGDGAKVYDFSIRWGVLMSGRLRRVEHYYRADELTGDQTRRYREIRRELQDLAPRIESLGIRPPTVPLED